MFSMPPLKNNNDSVCDDSSLWFSNYRIPISLASFLFLKIKMLLQRNLSWAGKLIQFTPSVKAQNIIIRLALCFFGERTKKPKFDCQTTVQIKIDQQQFIEPILIQIVIWPEQNPDGNVELREGVKKKSREKYGLLPNPPRTPPHPPVWSFFRKKNLPPFFFENCIFTGWNEF